MTPFIKDKTDSREMPGELFVSLNPRYPELGAMYLTSSVAGRPPFMGTRYVRDDLVAQTPDVEGLVNEIVQLAHAVRRLDRQGSSVDDRNFRTTISRYIKKAEEKALSTHKATTDETKP